MDTDAHNDYAPVALRVDPVLFRCWDIVKNNPVVTLSARIDFGGFLDMTGLLSDALHATTEVTRAPVCWSQCYRVRAQHHHRGVTPPWRGAYLSQSGRGRAARLGMLFPEATLSTALAAYCCMPSLLEWVRTLAHPE